MWDDNELVDDYWKHGADNHDDDKRLNVSFNQRTYNAYHGFYEYIPMRLDNLKSKLHNSYSSSYGKYNHN